MRAQLPGQRSVGIEQPALTGVPDRAVAERLLHAHAGSGVRRELDPDRVASGDAATLVLEPFDVVGVVLRPEADDNRAPTVGGDRAQIPGLGEGAWLGYRVGRTSRVPGNPPPTGLHERERGGGCEEAPHYSPVPDVQACTHCSAVQRNVTQAYLQADRLVPASTIDNSKGCLRRIVRVLVCRSPQHECTEQARPRARRRSTSRSLVPRDERGGRTAATRQLIRLKRTGRDGEPLCVPLPGGWPALEASATRWICFGAGRSSGFEARAGTAAAGAARVRVAHSRRARGGLPRAARRRARND